MSLLRTQGPVTVLDLHHQTEGTVAAFLVRTPEGPVLVETGPEALFGRLRAAVEAEGFALEDIRHVFVTHIHLDHAGAAWRLARHGARVYVHPAGVPHLLDPSRLMASAARIYGADMDRLWGRLEPIDADRIVAMDDGQDAAFGGLRIQALHTPGHATHHITYRLEDGLFTGDVGGIRLGEGPVIPPFPPPDIHLEDWSASLARMRATGARWVCPTHFGIFDDAEDHWDSLEEHLGIISRWVREGMAGGASEDELIPPFQAFMADLLAKRGLPARLVEDYETADPAFMSVQGLLRYWRKQDAGAAARG